MIRLATALVLGSFPAALGMGGAANAQSTFSSLVRTGYEIAPGRFVDLPSQIAGNATGAGYAMTLSMSDGSGEIWFDFVDDGVSQPQFAWANPAGPAYIRAGGLYAASGSMAWSVRDGTPGAIQDRVFKDGVLVAATGGGRAPRRIRMG